MHRVNDSAATRMPDGQTRAWASWFVVPFQGVGFLFWMRPRAALTAFACPRPGSFALSGHRQALLLRMGCGSGRACVCRPAAHLKRMPPREPRNPHDPFFRSTVAAFLPFSMKMTVLILALSTAMIIGET